MSIFGKIMSAIFGTKAEAAPAGGGAAGGAAPAGGAAAGGAPAQTVDVAPILDKAVAAKGEKLHEHLAAQTGHDQTGSQRRQAAAGNQALICNFEHGKARDVAGLFRLVRPLRC